jgi:hypothetical protein
MVTKTTGRGPGRPKKQMVTTSTPKRGPGQPLKPLSTNPDRYWFAEAQAWIDYHAEAGTGVSANQIAEMFIGLRYGRLPGSYIETKGGQVSAEENFESFINDAPFFVYADPAKGHIRRKGAVQEKSEDYRNRNIFRPHADDLLRNLRSLRAEVDPWLSTMVQIYRHVQQGGFCDPRRMEGCRLLAESKHFERIVKPRMIGMAAARKVGFNGEYLPPGYSLRTKKQEEITGRKKLVR